MKFKMNDKEYTYDIDKYTIGVDENGEDGIGLTVAKVENGKINFLGNCYGENARCLDLLIKENKELKKKYENAVADYETTMAEKNELEKKLYYLKQDIETLYLAGKELINSINKDYLDIIINIDEPKAYFKKPELVEATIKRIAVPIKQDLLENYVYWINYYKSKHELGDDK